VVRTTISVDPADRDLVPAGQNARKANREAPVVAAADLVDQEVRMAIKARRLRMASDMAPGLGREAMARDMAPTVPDSMALCVIPIRK
jgi:hypothetical protein